MADNQQPNRYLCIAVDVSNYSGNDLWGQDTVMADLRALLDAAAADARLDRLTWQIQEQGDAELALVPVGPDEPRVMGELTRCLDARLNRFNRPRRPEARLRLRLAFHSGWAVRSAMGFAGEAVVRVFRLLDSDVIKQTLAAATTANLAVIVSQPAFETIDQGLTTLPPAEFRRVRARRKEFDGDAWVWVPGGITPVAAAVDPPAPAPAPRPDNGHIGVVINGGNVAGPVAGGDGATAIQYRYPTPAVPSPTSARPPSAGPGPAGSADPATREE